MLNSIKNIFWLLFLVILILPSCKSKKIISESGKLKKLSSKKILKNLTRNEITAEWLSAKAEVAYSDKSQKQKFVAYVRHKKDALIWMSIRKFNLEIARVMIRPDSVFIINRFGKEYIPRKFDFLTERFNLPIDFYDLQAAIVGKPVFLNKNELKADIDKKNYTLAATSSAQLREKYWIDGAIFVLKKMAFVDKEMARTISFEYDDYQATENEQLFSYFRSIHLDSKEIGNSTIIMKLSKVELNQKKKIKFDVPSSYKQK